VNYEDTFGRKIKNDNLKDFRGFLKGVYDSMFLVLKDNAPAYVCYAERTVLEFRTVAVEAGFEWRNTLIWLKDVPAGLVTIPGYSPSLLAKGHLNSR
jgi:DNA modification methylase